MLRLVDRERRPLMRARRISGIVLVMQALRGRLEGEVVRLGRARWRGREVQRRRRMAGRNGRFWKERLKGVVERMVENPGGYIWCWGVLERRTYVLWIRDWQIWDEMLWEQSLLLLSLLSVNRKCSDSFVCVYLFCKFQVSTICKECWKSSIFTLWIHKVWANSFPLLHP